LDLVFAALLFAHFVGLMLVATAFLALIGMMPKAAGGTPPQTSRYLTRLGHYGIIIAIVSGPLLLWQRYGGFDGVSHWFWVKMACLVVLAGGVVMSAMSARKMREGDAAAASRVRLGRIIAAASLVGVVLAAVLAFG
jgi:uncharacterized membrane protein